MPRFQTRMGWVCLALILLLAACSTASTPTDSTAVDASALPDMVSAQQLAELQEDPAVTVLDVREEWEYEEGHIPGVTHIPMAEVSARLDDIPRDETVIVTCRSGNRSGQIASFLREQGYTNVHNLEGGIIAWENAGLPVER